MITSRGTFNLINNNTGGLKFTVDFNELNSAVQKFEISIISLQGINHKKRTEDLRSKGVKLRSYKLCSIVWYPMVTF